MIIEFPRKYRVTPVATNSGKYDAFQYENFIKPDYSNAGRLEVYENGEWSEWYDEYGCDLSEIMSDRWNYDD